MTDRQEISDKTPEFIELASAQYYCKLPRSEESIEILIAVLKQIKRDITESEDE